MERRKSKLGDEKLIYDESADMVDRDSAIFRLAVDGYEEMQPFLENLLNHSQYMLRSRAIKVLLGGWGLSKYFDKAVEMLHSDPDYSVRSGACFALSQYASNFEDGRKRRDNIISQLIRRLLEESDVAVQESCYDELLRIIEGKRFHSKNYEFNRNKDVDWKLFQPYLEKYNLEKPKHT